MQLNCKHSTSRVVPLIVIICFHHAEVLGGHPLAFYLTKYIENLAKSFQKKDIHNAENIALNIFKNIPALGSVVKLFMKDQDMESTIKEVSKKLDQISNDVSFIKAVVQKIPSIIQISVIQQQVAKGELEINHCYLESLTYLKNPTDTAEIDEMKKCYDIFKYVRAVSRILLGEPVTFNQHSLFQEIKWKSGFCNGTEITNIFKYLYGLLTKGCIAVGIAEQVKFENSTRINEECQSFVPRIFTFVREFYSSCQTSNVCMIEKEHNFMLRALSSNLTDSVQFFETLFPWYLVTMIKTTSPLDYEILDSVTTPSVMTMQKGSDYLSVLWFPVKAMFLPKLGNNVLNFQAKIEGRYEIENGLDLAIIHHNEYDMLWGSVNMSDSSVQKFHSCYYDIKPPQQAVSETGLSYWVIALIVIVCLETAVILGYCVKKFPWKRCFDYY